MLDIHVIIASTNEGVIGKDNRLPWRIPNDLKWFKANTYGGTIIMVHNTFKSLGNMNLNNRHCIVVTRTPFENLPKNEKRRPVCFVRNVVAALHRAKKIAEHKVNKTIFIIGGASLLSTLPHIDSLVLTRILKSYDGDVRIPKYWETMKLCWRSKLQKHNDTEYYFEIYKKKV